MNSARSVSLLVAVLLLGLTVAPVASGTFASVGADDRSDEQHDGTVERGVTTFMQSSAADTANTVESEMFEARYEDADDETRERLVDERTDSLAAQLEDLEREHDRLQASDDELSTPQYQARMTRLTVEIVALEQSIEQTKPFAVDNEVGTDRLESIDAAVTELGDEQIAAVATELLGFEQFLDDEPIVEDAGADAEDDTTADEEAESAPADGEQIDEENDGERVDEMDAEDVEADDADPVDETGEADDAEDTEADESPADDPTDE